MDTVPIDTKQGGAMQWHARKLLTVIAEAALERKLIEASLALGIGGYTISEVRGGGAHGVRAGEWEGERSIEFKVLCDADAADRLAGAIMERYSRHFALVLYTTDVGVLRSEKFS